MKRIVVVAFFFSYFNISGLATTNIMRLTKNNTLPILSSKCVCDNCGAAISPFFQLPIISYVLCKGKCSNCKSKLPLKVLCLEIFVLCGMFLISVLFSFSFVGITLSFVYYEIVRIITIIANGKRAEDFLKQYIIAFFSMIPYCLLLLFVSAIYTAV